MLPIEMVNYSGGIVCGLLVLHTSSLTGGEKTGSWLIWRVVGLNWRRSVEREACGLQKLLLQPGGLVFCQSKRQSTRQWGRVACPRDSWGCAAVWQQHWAAFRGAGCAGHHPALLREGDLTCKLLFLHACFAPFGALGSHSSDLIRASLDFPRGGQECSCYRMQGCKLCVSRMCAQRWSVPTGHTEKL